MHLPPMAAPSLPTELRPEVEASIFVAFSLNLLLDVGNKRLEWIYMDELPLTTVCHLRTICDNRVHDYIPPTTAIIGYDIPSERPAT